MHQYDVASKILMETCRDEIIRHFAGIDVAESALIEELPQETVSLKRSDFPVMIKDRKGRKELLVIELQTDWRGYVPLHLLDYRTRYQIKYKIDPTSFVILLKPSGSASDVYQNSEVRFTFRLIKIYEMDAREIIDGGPMCLAPFVPLMKGGAELMAEADDLIYKSERTRRQKADLLTSMAILSGIVSEDLPARLINRRKDIMIESAAYDIIKKDGIKEGIREGMILDAREMLIEAIGVRFETVPEDMAEMVARMSDRDTLKQLHRQAIICEDIHVLRTKLSTMLQ